jgi:hypothetical protein
LASGSRSARKRELSGWKSLDSLLPITSAGTWIDARRSVRSMSKNIRWSWYQASADPPRADNASIEEIFSGSSLQEGTTSRVFRSAQARRFVTLRIPPRFASIASGADPHGNASVRCQLGEAPHRIIAAKRSGWVAAASIAMNAVSDPARRVAGRA